MFGKSNKFFIRRLRRLKRSPQGRLFFKERPASTEIQQKTINGPSFIKNIFLLFLILVISAAMLGRILLHNNKELEASNDWISHSYTIIEEEEKIPALLTDMLANQRAYLLTNQRIFLAQYITNKQDFIKSLDHLDMLTQGNSAQIGRFQKMRKLFKAFYSK